MFTSRAREAERAATAAERKGASPAAHATAHQEVATAQADLADQVALRSGPAAWQAPQQLGVVARACQWVAHSTTPALPCCDCWECPVDVLACLCARQHALKAEATARACWGHGLGHQRRAIRAGSEFAGATRGELEGAGQSKASGWVVCCQGQLQWPGSAPAGLAGSCMAVATGSVGARSDSGTSGWHEAQTDDPKEDCTCCQLGFYPLWLTSVACRRMGRCGIRHMLW